MAIRWTAVDGENCHRLSTAAGPAGPYGTGHGGKTGPAVTRTQLTRRGGGGGGDVQADARSGGVFMKGDRAIPISVLNRQLQRRNRNIIIGVLIMLG